MSLQQNVNNTISLATLLYSQTPGAKAKAEFLARGRALQSKGLAAEEGLKNIYNNYNQLKTGKRAPYSETELNDIENRIPQLNNTIYDAIIAKEDPNLGKYIDKSAFEERATRSAKLKELEGFREANELAKVQRAKQSAADKAAATVESGKASKNFINNHLNRLPRFSDPQSHIKPLKSEEGGL